MDDVTAIADPEFDARYRAVHSRDRRFDGRFFTAVLSTGIYCRPICPARTPRRDRVRFYDHAAAAEVAGFRACRRCRPDLGPGAPDHDVAADLVARALRLISAGVVDGHGVSGLAARLHVSERHLTRVFTAEVGAGPLRVARSRRARLARQLLDATDLPVTEVAHAAGFASIRTFNATFREVYAATPTELRKAPGDGSSTLRLDLQARQPFDADRVLGFLAARTTAGIDAVEGGTYQRVLAAAGDAPASLTVTPTLNGVRLEVSGEPAQDLAWLVHAVREQWDLDGDPHDVAAGLGSDPALAPLLSARPGLRLVGAFDGWEGAARVLLGQQVSVAAASTLAARLVERCGTTSFPTAGDVAEADLEGFGMPASRLVALRGLAVAVADGTVVLDGGESLEDVRAALAALRGIGPWTVEVIAMRVLRDPDAFPGTDLGVLHAAASLGLPTAGPDLLAHAERWRPWRAYAVQHLWTHLAEQERP